MKLHRDQVTDREYLFVGAACGGLYKVVYDPSAPGRIRWVESDELDKSYGRIHSLCICNGSLYVSADYGGLTVQSQTGGVFRRSDGAKPTWERVYRNYDPKYPTWNQTGRGITAVPAEDGSGKEVILVGIEDPPEAVIVRIEPHHDHQAVVELNYHDYCRDVVFRREFPKIGGSAQYPAAGADIAALNYFEPFIEPETGKTNHFVTLIIAHPDDPAEGCNNAYFLMRRAPGLYDWGEIPSGLPLGENLRGTPLLLSDGAWDTFRDVSAKLGARNETAYNRQTSIADVNHDGWLDIAIGCDNIGNAMGGVPHSRLYVFKPGAVSWSPDRDTGSTVGFPDARPGDRTVGDSAGSGDPRRAFEDGHFEDIGGTDRVPDFGGFYHDSVKDKAGPGITLRDLDNDGWLDLVVLDRHESPTRPVYRAALFMNRGDGTFQLKPTTFSGLDSTGISGEAADLNNDGLLDIIIACDPDNSGGGLARVGPERYQDKVYINTGEHGARQNHWLRLRFSGIKDAELVGARVEVHEPVSEKLLGTRWIYSNHSYKSGGPLEAHFGLRERATVNIVVTLPNGRTLKHRGVQTDQYLDLNCSVSQLSPVTIGTKP